MFLESRQLRTSQIQASRTFHVELIRLAMNYPPISGIIEHEISSDDYQKYAFLGLLLESWELDYELKTMSARAIQGQARIIFKSDYARTWWERSGRKAWNEAATTKNEREFFALIEGEFGRAASYEPGSDSGAEANEPGADS